MGHVGLTPQTATALGGYGPRARPPRPRSGAEEALALQSVGCFAIVFEAVPAAVTEAMVELEMPSIGIGAGPATDGQVLVFHDLLGIYTGHTPKFVKRYADVHERMVDAVARYRPRSAAPLPRARARLPVDPDELADFRAYLDQESLASQKAWEWEPLS